MSKEGLDRIALLELEGHPAFRRLLKEWALRRENLITKLAYDSKIDPILRAEMVGQLKEIDELLNWVKQHTEP